MPNRSTKVTDQVSIKIIYIISIVIKIIIINKNTEKITI